ncbi:MAG TPA: hypothetical protein ENK43_17740 [Planctomycetes bacterium]|nr:hypothetical protein [Planctomycetota bacterium]
MTSKKKGFMDGGDARNEPSSPPRPASSWREDPRFGKGGPPRPRLDDACISYLQMHAAFEDQRRPGSHARKHIDQCEECQKHLARSKWEREQEAAFLSSKEVTDLVAEYARRFRVPFWQRRRVQLTGALVLLLACVALVIFLATKNATRGADSVLFINPAVGNSGSITPNADRALQDILTDLDRAYQEDGVQAIAKIFARGTEQEALRAEHWMALRVDPNLIGVLISALSDPRLKVRAGALATLKRMPPLSVKPYQGTLNAAASSETNPELSTLLQAYATEIARAR